MDLLNNRPTTPFMGIIMLDTIFPRIKGDIGNPATFRFPVRYKVVNGASPERLVIQADKTLIQPFIEAGRSLIREGAYALATSCGFMALFHKELTQALNVPVFSSSLLQVHLAQSIIKKDQKVGIITARKTSLTQQHLAAVGIEHYPLAIIGMETAEEFSSVFIKGKPTLDREKCQQEMRTTALKLITSHPDIGAIVLECTNMPPYAKIIHAATGGVPIFDVITMINTAHSTLIYT
ncbi:aspartate/glutamate racemase family protein [Desulfobacula sp.]|uniref:aspartate/glutamate racemase family protein n=1 Tax=Desulfobacula sp. TaxID=2593537 RepID=UPI00261E6108|nr:aspartate/glutamate racemase family protein [Desulfobacula sp.]